MSVPDIIYEWRQIIEAQKEEIKAVQESQNNDDGMISYSFEDPEYEAYEQAVLAETNGHDHSQDQ